MGRNFYNAAHTNCPEAGETVYFDVLVGNPTVCTRCKQVVEPDMLTEKEFNEQYQRNPEKVT